MSRRRAAAGRAPRRADRGQSTVEFALIVPVFMLLLLGLLEFGMAFDHTITLSYATREGARTASALVNGGGALGCGGSASPDAATVDPRVVAAVQRVLTSPGSQVAIARVSEIRIYRATATGAETAGSVNVWHYDPGNGPTVDGEQLDFSVASVGWPACTRSNANPPESVGVSLRYRYEFATPLAAVLNLIGGSGATGLDVSDRTVMAMNPT